jgi:hypothetical protein
MRGYDSFDAKRALPAAEASRVIAKALMGELQDFKERIDGDG